MGLAFNLLLYFIPLVLLMIALLGYTILESSRAMTEVQSFVGQLLPQSEHILADNFAAIVAHRGLLGATGWIFFLLFSSTLFGSARHVLNTVFKTPVRRTFVKGLLRDFLMMTLTAIIVVLAIGAGISGSIIQFGRPVGVPVTEAGLHSSFPSSRRCAASRSASSSGMATPIRSRPKDGSSSGWTPRRAGESPTPRSSSRAWPRKPAPSPA